jgi:hypothetical protein
MARLSASMLLLPIVFATASCGILYQPVPIFGDHQVRYILGDHRPDPILPGDAVTTKKQAIQLAMKGCPPPERDPDTGFWEAHLDGNTWIVYYEHNIQSVSAKINKSNGAFEECDINDADE